jgi:hypothetical protein
MSGIGLNRSWLPLPLWLLSLAMFKCVLKITMVQIMVHGNLQECQEQWFMPIIPPTQEVEIGRIVVHDQCKQKSL